MPAIRGNTYLSGYQKANAQQTVAIRCAQQATLRAGMKGKSERLAQLSMSQLALLCQQVADDGSVDSATADKV
jgi:hypothetical protein